MPDWASLLLLTLTLMLVAGQYWRSGRKDFWRYGLIWVVIIAVVAVLYSALAPRFIHQGEPDPLSETQSKNIDL